MGFNTGFNLHNNEKGFTVVELILVLALLGIALAGIFQFFDFTQRSYAIADTQSAVIQEVNLFFTQIEKEIRAASEPNEVTNAVRIINNGQQIDIYSYRDVPTSDPNVTTRQYSRISYRLNPNDTTKLEEGWVTTTTAPPTTENPQYGTIPDTGTGSWKTVVSNISPGDMEIFRDRNAADTISSRRLIDINLNVSHPRLISMISMDTSIMSRTGKSTESIQSSSSTAYVPVTSIIIDPASITAPKNGNSYSIKATVVPANATNKNVIWSQNFGSTGLGILPAFVVFPDYQFTYDDNTAELDDLDLDLNTQIDRLTTRSGKAVSINVSRNTWYWPLPNPREARIEVRSPDIPDTPATLTITQPR